MSRIVKKENNNKDDKLCLETAAVLFYYYNKYTNIFIELGTAATIKLDTQGAGGGAIYYSPPLLTFFSFFKTLKFTTLWSIKMSPPFFIRDRELYSQIRIVCFPLNFP